MNRLGDIMNELSDDSSYGEEFARNVRIFQLITAYKNLHPEEFRNGPDETPTTGDEPPE